MQSTDFIIKLAGNKDGVEFRHTAPTIRDFLSIEDEFIFDLYESQYIRKSEIASVKLDPRPYMAYFMASHGRIHRSLTELWEWVDNQNEVIKTWQSKQK
jgi:hypothetical protein